MKLTSALSLVAVGVISVLQVSQAATVYEIVNIEDFDLKGTLDTARAGYGTGININDEMVGIAKGKKKLTTEEIEEDDDNYDFIDIEDGIADEEEIIYSIYSPLEANNFTFEALENDPVSAWTPNFVSVNGSIAPDLIDLDNTDQINSVDAYFFDINNAGISVGMTTGQEIALPYTGTDYEDQEYWYYRDYEQRGFVKDGDIEVELVPPFTEYTTGSGNTGYLGGWSAASAINQNNLIAGYTSTDIGEYSDDNAEYCIDNDTETFPTEICLQNEQYPDEDGYREILYQVRAAVWQYDSVSNSVTETVLPLGLDEDSSSYTFTAQGLGINNNGVVAGRSHVYRYDDDDRLAQDAAYWTLDANGDYQYNWVPVIDGDDVYNSIAYDINDNGILIGTYYSYIEGYLRNKFFLYDINTPDTLPTTPSDFTDGISDLSSYPYDINNNGQVVGSIEYSNLKETPRPRVAFLYDINTEEFNNINDLLTCESKGYERDANGDWVRHQVSIQDGTGEDLSYESEIVVVEGKKINEDGTIVGTAFIRKPSYELDDNGDLVTNDNGEAIFELNGNGEPLTAYLPRMVVLKPVANGEACVAVNEEDVDEPFERSGGASFLWLLLAPLAWLRRKTK